MGLLDTPSTLMKMYLGQDIQDEITIVDIDIGKYI